MKLKWFISVTVPLGQNQSCNVQNVASSEQEEDDNIQEQRHFEYI